MTMVWLSERVTRGRSDVFHARRECGSALFDIRAPQRAVEAAGLRRCRRCQAGDHAEHMDTSGRCAEDNPYNADCRCPARPR